jgi:DNA-nicking Smr family endonuclease
VSKRNKPSSLPPQHASSSQTLHDFADLKKALKQAAREAQSRAQALAEEKAKAQAEQARQKVDSALFQQMVGKVNPLPDSGRVVPKAMALQAVPRQSQADDKAVMDEALSDEFDVESLLETDDSLAFRRASIGADVLRKLRRGVWALQGQVDLHGLRTEEARIALSDFLKLAQTRGWRCVRVVHGKGLGSPGRVPVIKDKVKRWLVQSDKVLAFVQARGDEGGAGALIVLLQSG